ncbi:MAG: sugar kinase [Burkholderiales bacterium]|nr:sugar kinase [Burkholderiales bacterium]MDE2452766.1 sugar kinase [Burkholderiales bacterium]
MSAAKTLDVVALGEAMVEFNQGSGGLGWAAGFGGDTSNCVIAAARMGAASGYLTQLGSDAFGDDLVELWRTEGVDTAGVRRVEGAETGLYFVRHGAQGHRFDYRRAGSAASRMRPADLAPGLVERSRWLHVSGISQAISSSACDTVFEAVARARAAGTRVSFDLNFRPALWPAPRALATLRATLAQCDLFFPSVDEAQALIGLDQPADIVAWAHDQGVARVALKLGARGSLVSAGDGLVEVAPFPVTPLDATGAGDCFAGAMLARLAAGDELAAAARAANIAAALSTQGYGAVAPLPRWSDVQPRLG